MSESRVYLITAAGKGMGAACARELAKDGARLALLSPSGAADTAEAVRAAGCEAIQIPGSVTETTDLDRLVDEALSRWGRIDGLVANTGHPPKGELIELSDDDWHAGLDLVLLHTVRLARRLTPLFLDQGHGSIVNISTFAAFEPSLDFPISSALRAGLGAYTKLYADRYGAHGIRMNSVLPGFIDSYPESDAVVARIPAKRYGKVEEIAATVAFLMSDAAAYINGQNLRVDGGLARSV